MPFCPPDKMCMSMAEVPAQQNRFSRCFLCYLSTLKWRTTPSPCRASPGLSGGVCCHCPPPSLTKSSLPSSPTRGLILTFHAHLLCRSPNLVVDSFLEGLPPAKDIVTSRCSHCNELRICQAPSYALTTSFLEILPSPRVDGNFKHYGRLGGAGIQGCF